jgi:methylenetetrahydrofolate--tRNA-(uracil-5-)-methyltransferase
MTEITIIGGGLAGVEAAWQVVKRGGKARLFEMKPVRYSPAHKNENLAELVCSNSFKSLSLENASGVLKREMSFFGSLVLESAEKFRVPAGGALAVDREQFSAYITERLGSAPGLELIREEIVKIPESGIAVIAGGPLASDALAKEIERITGKDRLYFYDAIAPVVYAESIDMKTAFRKSRYDKGGDDYINCPMNTFEYERFYEELIKAETVPLREFEKPVFFEGCLPIEEMARRGKETVCYGPMKPVGLNDPRTGMAPFAIVQLRQENISAQLYGLVGFQTRLRYPEQERVFRLIPGLEQAEFARLGSMHRNTYIDSPRLLAPDLSLRAHPQILFAGQITGVEGYMESSAIGIAAGIFALLKAQGRPALLFPEQSLIGSLIRHVSTGPASGFVPMNANFGLLPALGIRHRKKDRKKLLAAASLESINGYAAGLEPVLPWQSPGDRGRDEI